MDFNQLSKNIRSIETFYREQSKNIKLLNNYSQDPKIALPIKIYISCLQDCFELIDELIKLDSRNISNTHDKDDVENVVGSISRSILLVRNTLNTSDVDQNKKLWPEDTAGSELPNRELINKIFQDISDLFEMKILSCMSTEDQSAFNKSRSIYESIAEKFNRDNNTYDTYCTVTDRQDKTTRLNIPNQKSHSILLGKILQNIVDHYFIINGYSSNLSQEFTLEVPLEHIATEIKGDKQITDFTKNNVSYELILHISDTCRLYLKKIARPLIDPDKLDNVRDITLHVKVGPEYTFGSGDFTNN